MKKIIFLLLTCILSTFTSCSNVKNQRYDESKILMDTLMTLTAYGKDGSNAINESFQKIEEIDKMANPSNANSYVSLINAAAGKNYIQVPSELIKMIKTSVNYSTLSNGTWDITIGPLINLWGIGTDKARVPSETEIKEKLSLVDYNKILINEQDSSIMLKDEGMSIDLGGIAKGFAADEVLKIYKKYNIEKGLINLGSSSIYAIGKNEEEKGWSIGIKHPRKDGNENMLGIIRISDEALSTSGDYERFFIQNDKRYHHLLDPKTGYPADSGAISDTIIIDGSTENCSMLADILTTTVFVLGPQKGIEFVESLPNVSCEITTTDNKIYTSSNFKNRLENLNNDFKID